MRVPSTMRLIEASGVYSVVRAVRAMGVGIGGWGLIFCVVGVEEAHIAFNVLALE